MRLILLIAIALVAAIGCATSDKSATPSNSPGATRSPTVASRTEFAARFAKIEEGMTAKQARDILGRPDEIHTKYDPGGINLYHVDLYRIERAAELPELGLDDVIGDPRGIVVVEWADRFAVLPADHVRLELAHAGDARTIEVTGTGPRGEELAAALAAAVLGFA